MSDLLTVRDLNVAFAVAGGIIKVVDGVSFSVPQGRTNGERAEGQPAGRAA